MNEKVLSKDRAINTHILAALAILVAITLATAFGSYKYLENSRIEENLVAPLTAIIAVAAFLVAHRLLVANVLAKRLTKKLEEIEKHNITANN
ncbi:MAG: hypothetical protein WC788_03815 [Candidatus Paceibacterota bacterium]